MRNTSCLIIVCIIFGLIAVEVNAQDLQDEMKRRIRQSINTPEKQPGLQSLPLNYRTKPARDEILKVSPFTRLPTRGDRIQILHSPEEYEIHICMTVTNSTPINQLPPGSVRYEFVGKNMQMISTAGKMVVPSGHDRGPIRKRHRKKANILKALQK